MTIRAGKLRHVMEIEQATESRNAIGEAIQTWSTFATRHVSVEPFQGREFWSAKQVNAERNLRVRMRYLEGLTTKMRLNWRARSRLFDILSIVDVNERNHEMLLLVEERL